MDMVEWTKEIGPFSAPLCAFMFIFGGAVLRWLLKDRDRLLVIAKEHADDAKALREKRIDDREKAATEYREFGEVMRAELNSFGTQSKALLDLAARRSTGEG